MKMSKNNLIVTEIEEDDELWQFEHDTDYSKYIYGVASHGLFVSLVARLGEMGYTEKELRKEIKIWLNTSVGQVIH